MTSLKVLKTSRKLTILLPFSGCVKWLISKRLELHALIQYHRFFSSSRIAHNGAIFKAGRCRKSPQDYHQPSFETYNR